MTATRMRVATNKDGIKKKRKEIGYYVTLVILNEPPLFIRAEFDLSLRKILKTGGKIHGIRNAYRVKVEPVLFVNHVFKSARVTDTPYEYS